MKESTLLSLVFFVSAALAVAAHFFLFAFRYMWYVKSDAAVFLLVGYALCLLLVVLLWFLKPSPTLIGIVGIIPFVFPPLLRSDEFVPWDTSFTVFVFISIILLVGVTLVRRISL